MTNKTYNLYFFALFYAIFITCIVPWTTIYQQEFVDVLNYLNRIEYLHKGGNEAIHTGISWLLNEPLWKYIIIALALLLMIIV